MSSLRGQNKPGPSDVAPVDALERIEREIVACARCPELRAYTAQLGAVKKRAYRNWNYWARPVPAFGDVGARIMLVGLAPGAHGSNRTGRMFTGDGSGEWLYRALFRAGLCNQPLAESRDDGLVLHDTFITAAVRCAPPQNKPTPNERARCLPYLEREFALLADVQVIVTLGKLADDTVFSFLRSDFRPEPDRRAPFAHGALTRMVGPAGRTLYVLASYHPSRQNTNTGKLTEVMLDAIFAQAVALVRG